VVFIGDGDAAADTAYRRFNRAMRLRLPMASDPCRPLRVGAADERMASLQLAVRRALQHQPAVMVAPSGDAARAALPLLPAQTALVFASYLDPVRSGLVDSMRRRQSAITGLSLADWLHAKRLELLHEAFPKVQTVGVLVDQSWIDAFDGESLLHQAGKAVGLSIVVLRAESAVQVEQAFAEARMRGVQAWYLPTTFVADVAATVLAQALQRSGLPVLHADPSHFERSGQLAYTQATEDAYEILAELALRTCRGEFAGDIPIERPRRQVLTVRLVGQAPALRSAPSVVRRADKVL